MSLLDKAMSLNFGYDLTCPNLKIYDYYDTSNPINVKDQRGDNHDGYFHKYSLKLKIQGVLPRSGGSSEDCNGSYLLSALNTTETSPSPTPTPEPSPTPSPEKTPIPEEIKHLIAGDAKGNYPYLTSDNGVIYVAFDESVNATLRDWWEWTIAKADSIIEPDFSIVEPNHPQNQLTIYQANYDSVRDGAGHWESGNPAKITIDPEALMENSVGFVLGTGEPSFKVLAAHELGHALGLEHNFDDSDGDALEADTNHTVMSYDIVTKDDDGIPSFTDFDEKALQYMYGKENERNG